MKRSRWILLMAGVLGLGLAGCSQDPATQSPTSVGKSSSTVGDDTYVPGFQVGDLVFDEVWVEDVAVAGMSTTIRFDVTHTGGEALEDVQVRFDLSRLEQDSVEDLDVSDPAFVPDYLAAFQEIPRIEPGETLQLSHEFRVPQQIPEGLYAGVFTITYQDAQGDYPRSLAKAPGSILIGVPNLPNLRFVSHSLGGVGGNSFELPRIPAPRWEEAGISRPHEDPALLVNLEVESMGLHTRNPVELDFQLDLPGVGTFPLLFTDNTPESGVDAVSGESVTLTRLQQKYTYPTECKEFAPNGAEILDLPGVEPSYEGVPEEICASLFRQTAVGRAFEIYLTEEATSVLGQQTQDQVGELVVRLDPDQTIPEWKSLKQDNLLRIPVIFLAQSSAPARTSGLTEAECKALTAGPYCQGILSFDTQKDLGVEKWKAGYHFYSDTNYETLGSTSIPGMFYTNQDDSVYVVTNGKQTNLFKFDLGVDLNINNITNSYFFYYLEIPSKTRLPSGSVEYFMKVTQYNLSFPNEGLWDTCDLENGGCSARTTDFEKWTLWTTLDTELREQRFLWYTEQAFNGSAVIGPVPIAINGGFSATYGYTAELVLLPGNKISFTPTAQALADGYISAGLGADIGIAKAKLGLAAEIQLLAMKLGIHPYMQIQPAVPKAVFGIYIPVEFLPFAGKIWFFLRATIDVPFIGEVGIPLDITLVDFGVVATALAEKLGNFRIPLLDLAFEYTGGADTASATTTSTCDYTVCDGLVGYYPLDGSADDLSDQFAHGKLMGTPLPVPGRSLQDNGLLELNGADTDFVSIAGSNHPNKNGAFSYSLWVYRMGDAEMTLVDAGRRLATGESGDDNHRSQLLLETGGTLKYRVGESAGGRFSQTVIRQEYWTHVALTKDNASNFRVYLNGEPVESLTLTGVTEQNLELDSASQKIPLNLGRSLINYEDLGLSADPFVGRLDDFRLYDRELSEAEVQAIYQAEQSDFVAYYPLEPDADNSSLIRDNSSQGAEARLLGGTWVTDRFGNANGALKLSGSSSEGIFLDNASATYFHPHPMGTNDDINVTYAAWVNLDQIGKPMSIVDVGERASNRRSAMLVDATGRLTYVAEGNNYRFPAQIAPKQWTHVAIAKSGQMVRGYINGVKAGKYDPATQTNFGADGQIRVGQQVSSAQIYIGRNADDPIDSLYPGAGLDAFQGRLDDLRIYRKALTAEEIKAIYQAEAPSE
jgi:hypothetical protein